MPPRRYSSVKRGNFDGVEILNMILAQEVTANFIAGKIYRFFVRDDLSPHLQKRLGAILRENDYEIKPLLRTIFLSKDFYSEPSVGTRIKGPVDLIVSMCRELGVKRLPGVPDFNSSCGGARSGAAQSAHRRRLGAGTELDYAGHVVGAREFRAPDAAAGHDQFRRSEPRSGAADSARSTTASCGRMSVTAATSEENPGTGMAEGRAMANVLADKEDFNTRYGSLNGWREAVRRVKPTLRAPAQFSLLTRALGAAEDDDRGRRLMLGRFLACRSTTKRERH